MAGSGQSGGRIPALIAVLRRPAIICVHLTSVQVTLKTDEVHRVLRSALFHA
jgi:hypothetical protein